MRSSCIHRLSLKNVYTPIWWYADFPNHYDGDGSKATRKLGETTIGWLIGSIAETLKMIKADTQTLKLQKEFFDRVKGD
jgi:creatinine amidohydrolase